MESTVLKVPQENGVSLEAYFERIGYKGHEANTLDVLQALHQAHVCTIPFENLDILLGKAIDITLPTLVEKLLIQRRGGYCFETNGFFAYILSQLGFNIDHLLGRVWYGQEYPAPSSEQVPLQTHQMTLVTLADGQRWLADVGFGGLGPIFPLKFEPGEEQASGPDTYRILPVPQFGYMLQCRTGDDWTNLYSFDLTPCFRSDYHLGNYYMCRSPETWFTQVPVAVQPHLEGRSILRGASLKQTGLSGQVVERQIHSVAEYQQILKDVFRLDFTLQEAERLIGSSLKAVD